MPASPTPAEDSCSSLREEWAATLTLTGRTPATARLYARHVEETFASLAASLDLATDALTLGDCSRRRLRAALLAYRDRPDRRHADPAAAPATRSHHALRLRLQALRSFFSWCVAEELLEGDPTLGLTLPPPTLAAAPTRPPALSASQLGALRAAAAASRNPLRDELVVALLAGLGCSLGELEALRLTDCDLAAGTLQVRGKPRTLPAGATRRSSSTPRTLTLPPSLAELLRAYLPARARTLTRWARTDEHLVLAGAHARTSEARTRSLAKALGRLLDAAGVDHAGRASGLLRASFAQAALERGAPPLQVASLMGLRSLDALAHQVELASPTPAPLGFDLLA